MGRRLLVAILLSVLGAAPLLVRVVSGDLSLEHVPEFEGLVYAVLIGLAVFADQCMVREREVPPQRERAQRELAERDLVKERSGPPAMGRSRPPGGRWPGARPAGPGAVGRPAGGAPDGHDRLRLPAARRRLLGGPVRGGAPAGRPGAPSSSSASGWSRAGGTVVAFFLLRAVGWAVPGLLELLDRTPLLIVGLGLTLAVIGAARIARGTLSVRFEAFRKGIALVGDRTVRFRQSFRSGGPRARSSSWHRLPCASRCSTWCGRGLPSSSRSGPSGWRGLRPRSTPPSAGCSSVSACCSRPADRSWSSTTGATATGCTASTGSSTASCSSSSACRSRSTWSSGPCRG